MIGLSRFLQMVPDATGIAQIDGKNTESAGGHTDEGWELFVCRRNGAPREIRITYRKSVYKAGDGSVVAKDSAITEEEYASHVKGGDFMDTPAKISAIKLHKIITGQLEDMRQVCSRCGIKMVERYNDRRKNYFWGCANFEKRGCRETLPMSAEYRELMKQLPRVD